MGASTMSDRISARGTTIQLRPEVYWHLTTPSSFLLHNVSLAEGVTPSISALRIAENDQGFLTPYSAANAHNPKEAVWESTRKAIDPRLPTRDGAMFLFPTELSADTAAKEWFGTEQRIKVQARLVEGSVSFQADARWLDCHPPDWQEHAVRYWRGEMTDRPRVEIVVLGTVYFPGWKDAPFGVNLQITF